MNDPETQPSPPTDAPSALTWLARGAAAGLVGGLAHGCVDTLTAAVRVHSPLFGVTGAIIVGIFIAGLLSLAGAVMGTSAAGLWLAVRRLAGRPVLAAAVVGAAASVPLWLLNGHILQVAPWLYWTGLPVATVGLAGAAAFVASPSQAARRGRVALALALASFVVFLVNARVLQGLYRPQHATLTWLALGAAGWALVLVGFRRPLAHRVIVVLCGLGVVLWLQTFVLLSDQLGQHDRGVVTGVTVEATHVVDALAALGDFDGDGVGRVLGGGDCDDFDPDVRPGLPEVLDDGVDQDCFAEDATTAGADALAAARAVHATPRPDGPRASRLVVITIDALRADRAGDMPALQRLAEAGVSFDRAYAPYPSTILTFFSMFSGRAPGAIQTTEVIKWLVPKDDPSETLGEVLAARGWTTTGLFFHHIFGPQHGLSRGFQDVWVESGDPAVVVWGRSSDQSTRRALAALEASPKDAFVWAHYYDPHEPYILHPEIPVAENDLVARYDAEVAWTDRHLAGLVDRLLSGDTLDHTLVVLTSDHGESLGEHGRRFHASSLGEEQIHVPFVVAGPGIPRGERRATPVSLLDLAATVCAELGVPAPKHQQGAALTGLLRAEPAPGGPVSPVFTELHGEAGTQRAVLVWPWKLVHHVEAHRFELYDLKRDPAEHVNVYDLLPEQAAQLEHALQDWQTLTRR